MAENNQKRLPRYRPSNPLTGKLTLGVVLAAGKGNRFTQDTPKQFTLLAGQPVFLHAAVAFEQSPLIDGIALVVPAGREDEVSKALTDAGISKTVAVIPGGCERQDSVKAAINAGLNGFFDQILLHDAARPLLSDAVIARVCEALKTAPAATAALPVTDTVAQTENGKNIAAIPDRSTLWQIQTPQGFNLYTLAEAYARLSPAVLAACTDDCGVVRAYLPSAPVVLAKGDRRLLKLTYPEDLVLLEALASARS